MLPVPGRPAKIQTRTLKRRAPARTPGHRPRMNPGQWTGRPGWFRPGETAGTEEQHGNSSPRSLVNREKAGNSHAENQCENSVGAAVDEQRANVPQPAPLDRP